MSSHSPIRTHAAQVLGSSWPVHANTNKLRNICHKSKFFVLTTMSLMFRPSYRACLGRHGQRDQDNGCTFHACKGFEGDRGFQVPVSFSCVPSRSSYEISSNCFATEANPPQPPLNDVCPSPPLQALSQLHQLLLVNAGNCAVPASCEKTILAKRMQCQSKEPAPGMTLTVANCWVDHKLSHDLRNKQVLKPDRY